MYLLAILCGSLLVAAIAHGDTPQPTPVEERKHKKPPPVPTPAPLPPAPTKGPRPGSERPASDG